MKMQELLEMDEKQLSNLITKLRSDYAILVDKVRSGKEKNHDQLKFLKRNIARIMTITGNNLHLN